MIEKGIDIAKGAGKWGLRCSGDAYGAVREGSNILMAVILKN